MQWIKEELVDSVDELRSSSSTRGISMPNFEVLDARIASALNRIIHNSHLKRSISLEEQEAQKQDRFLRGRQIAYLIYEYFGANDSVENYADLFTISLRNDDIQEFGSKWDGMLLSVCCECMRLGRHIHARVLRLEKGCRIRVTHVHTRSDCVHTRDDIVRLKYASRFVRVIYSSHIVSIKLDTVTPLRRCGLAVHE